MAAMSVGAAATAPAWLFVARAQANNPPTIVSVLTSNTSAGTSDDYGGGTIMPISGGTKTFYINGIAQDLDGQNTITNIRGVFYRSGATGGAACSNNGNDCRVVSTCGMINAIDTNQKVYNCQINLPYYADSTDPVGRYPSENWIAYVEVTDGTATASSSSLTKEINSLLSVTLPASIGFGNHAMGDVTDASTNVETTITQTGNVNADVELSMAAGMGCKVGGVPRANIKWAVSDVGFADGGSTAMTGTPVDTNLDVAYGTQSTPSPSKILYWNVSVPYAIGGSCNGVTTISAIKH